MIGISSRPVAAALLLAWSAMIWTVCTTSHVPHVPSYPWMPWAWNLGHAPLFGGFSALLAVTLRPGRCPGPRPRSHGSPPPSDRVPSGDATTGGRASPGAAAAGGQASSGGAVRAGASVAARRDERIWVAAALAGVAFGVLIEWRQSHVPGRTASLLDVATDAAGAFGVPWALATGALLTSRTLLVFVAAGIAAWAATYG